MNRNEEYQALLDELEATPPALTGTAQRAQARLRRRKLLLRPAQTLAAALLLFVMLVNVSPAFALACGRVPLLRELAAAVAFSPSLSAAVENEYVQVIGESQTDGGVTAHISYAIVDERQLTLFYTLESDRYQDMAVAHPGLKYEDNSQIESTSVSFHGDGVENDGLRQFNIDFLAADVPSTLRLAFDVEERDSFVPQMQASRSSTLELLREPEADEYPLVAHFEFQLAFDTSRIMRSEVIELEQTIELDGQRVTVSAVKIHPSHVELQLADDPANSAWLRALDFYLVDGRGRRYGRVSEGITASGAQDTPFMEAHRLESPYFIDSEHLTLVITGAEWLDKDKEYVRVDLAAGKADWLPDDMRLEMTQHTDEGWLLAFSAAQRIPPDERSFFQRLFGKEENRSYMHSLFQLYYRDPLGEKYDIRSWSSGGLLSESGLAREREDWFAMEFGLPDYPYDEVWLPLCYSHVSEEAHPVEIVLR